MPSARLRERFLTSSEVAELLGVGVSSVKRWTDEGELRAVRTIGGHRRYRADAVRALAETRGLEVDLPHAVPLPKVFDEVAARGNLLTALIRGDRSEAEILLRGHLLMEIDRAQLLDRVAGGAMKLIGDRWEEGSIGVECEHRASHTLIEILDQLRKPPRRAVGKATLASPPGERHDLPLRMVRLVLEWEGWSTDFLGADVPWSSITAAVRDRRTDLLLMSAPRSDAFLTDDFAKFAATIARRGVRIAIGGAWARGGVERTEAAILRFRSLSGFQRWLRSEIENRLRR